jgi:hypothetical protein
MTEQLQQAIEALQRLHSDAQNTIAAHILEEIEEREWDAIVRKPYVQGAFTRTWQTCTSRG